MALFSDDLFNIFDEEADPPSSKSKKRRREGKGSNESGTKETEKPKKPKLGEQDTTGEPGVGQDEVGTGQGALEHVIHGPEEAEGDALDEQQEEQEPPKTIKVPLFSEPAKIIAVQTLEGLACTHEVAVPSGCEYQPLKPMPATPAKEYPFVLDPFQREALLCVENQQSVLVSAHTSAGKTVVAEYAIALSLKDTQRVIYTTPIKALSNQKYREMYEQFKDVGLMTGDVTINPSASCIVMTTEILRSMLYRGSEVMREVGWVVFDEIHYMRDAERGVVWEETIILLPDNVHYVFLSATIHNARQFAEWICHLHKQPCHVVYTDYRPVPLQHYIYPAGADGLYLVVDEKRNFREDNFQSAMAILGDSAVANPRGRRGTKDNSSIFKVVKMIMERQLQPVIIFSFSRRECEALALTMSKLDFNSANEKTLIDEVFLNAIDILSDDDKKLPQVEHILPLLKRGIGVHHSGLLPILKETTEILFQEGLIKALFATETFSLGLNMPARTVVFTNARKFDGKGFRWITSGEYIQMSGRAGRRGLDDRGIVMLMVDEKMDSTTAKGLLKGQSDNLNSAFHLTYNMVLNLLRVEEVNPEYMLERSFFQFQNNSSIPGLDEKVRSLEAKRDAIVIENEESVTNYYRIRQQLNRLGKEMQTFITKPRYCVPFLQPGRLVWVEHEQEGDFGWGCIVNFQKKSNQKNTTETLYLVEVLLCCSTESCRSAPKDPPRPPPPGDKGEMQVVPVILRHLSKLSSVRVYLPKDLRSSDSRHTVRKTIQEVQRRFPHGLPQLDPAKDMKIKEEEFLKIVKKIEALESRLFASPVHKHPELEKLYNLCQRKTELNSEAKLAKKDLKKAQTVMQLDELKCRMRVLRRLGYANPSDVIEMKGRVACEISSGDELLLTEMIFNGAFNELSVEQAVALLSCFVFQEKTESMPKLTDELTGPLKMMQDSARRIARVSIEAKLELEEEEYVESFKPHLIDVVHAWTSGASFSQICKMTDVFEGSIIRCLRRLEELLRQMCQAAKAIGNTDLENKFAQGIVRIKRDIVFAASLYL